MKHPLFILLAVLLMGAAIPVAALAQTTPPPAPTADLMPPVTAESAVEPTDTLDNETHPPLKLMPDKSELVHLDREASSVVIGNAAQISVMLDTPKLAVVIPRAPGATYFSVLDKDGNVIMQRHVIVGSPKKNYVRIRRSCSNAAEGKPCNPTSVYFCPDLCHEIGNGSAATDASAAGASSAPAAVPQ